jgi:hypothetical protein
LKGSLFGISHENWQAKIEGFGMISGVRKYTEDGIKSG